MKKLKKYFKGFTLVELIIVITILSVLSTIAFVSFQWYTKNTRDGNRLATIKNIEKWLILFQLKSWNYPEPDEKINIEASGSIISYQWKVWENVSRIINMNTEPKDPVDETKYIYSTSENKNKYQLLAYMEWEEYITFFSQTYADDLTKRYPKVFWDNVWIILKEDNTFPTETTIETHTWTTNYKLFFQDNDAITSSWNTLFSNIYNRRDDLINNKDIAKFDNSLVWYWDMETLTQSWDTKYWLKDLSNYWNNWACYNSWSYVSCNWTEWWPKIVDWGWGNEKTMNFDWVDDSVFINNFYNKINYQEFSYFIKFNVNDSINKLNIPFNLRGRLADNSSLDRKNWIIRIKDKKLWIVVKWSWDLVQKEIITNNEYIQNKKYNNVFIKKIWLNFNTYLNWNILNELNTSVDWDTTLNDNIIYIWKHMYWIPNNPWETHNWYFYWLIDEIRVYNRALSDEEIKEIYNATK